MTKRGAELWLWERGKQGTQEKEPARLMNLKTQLVQGLLLLNVFHFGWPIVIVTVYDNFYSSLSLSSSRGIPVQIVRVLDYLNTVNNRGSLLLP